MIMDVSLNGLRVVDLTNIIMRPFTAQILEEFGYTKSEIDNKLNLKE